MAKVHIRSLDQNYAAGILEAFWPETVDILDLPDEVPLEVTAEFREAEIAASVGAWRGASALLRSALEKTLKINGYLKERDLKQRIDAAVKDGIITAARGKRAHEEVRVLGNDILHDEWRVVSSDEFDLSHHYVQRVLEDFYDDRPSIVAQLVTCGRLSKGAS